MTTQKRPARRRTRRGDIRHTKQPTSVTSVTALISISSWSAMADHPRLCRSRDGIVV